MRWVILVMLAACDDNAETRRESPRQDLRERIEAAKPDMWCSDAAHGKCALTVKACTNLWGQCTIAESYVCMTLKNGSSSLGCFRSRTQCMAALADPGLDANAYDCVVFRKGA